jgi:chromate reductase
VRILAISGSLQDGSANTRLVQAVADAAPDDHSVIVWQGLGEVPPFRPDVATDAAGLAVAELRRLVAASDIVLVATPEYAGGMPGTLKNAFDWLVGSGELYERDVVLVSAAPALERGEGGRRWAEETLRMQGAKVRASFSVALRSTDDREVLAAAVAEVLAALTSGD